MKKLTTTHDGSNQPSRAHQPETYWRLAFSLLFSAAVMLAGCHFDDGFSPLQMNRVTLKNTDTYTYETGIGGDEDGAAVITQANHYKRSEIVRAASTNWEVVYVYEPEKDYRGEDYVEIETYQGSDGQSPPTKVEIIRFVFRIE
jgi:hypothetical protein